MEMHRLKSSLLAELINNKTPGAYVLGIYKNGSFEPKYAGRSDSNLKARLMQHMVSGQPYIYFKFWKTETIYAAFVKECELYHKERSLINKIHPDSPRRIPYMCPFCLTRSNFESVKEVMLQ